MQNHKKTWLFGIIAVLLLAGVTMHLQSRQMYPRMMEEYGGGSGADYGGGYGEGVAQVVVDNKLGMADSRMMIEPYMTSMPAPDYYYGDGLGLDADYRMYDFSADYSVIVDDVQVYLRSVREYVLSIGGVVLNDSYYQGEKWTSGTLYAKVPVGKFSEASDRVVEGVEEIYNSSSNALDVTGSHVSATDRVAEAERMLAETQANLETVQALLVSAPEGSAVWRQYRTEVLQLENRVASYQRQLDRYQQNIDSIEEQVEYASILVSAADSKRYYDPRADISLIEHFKIALESLGSSGYMIATFLIWVVVYSVLWLPLVAFVIWLKKLLSKRSM